MRLLHIFSGALLCSTGFTSPMRDRELTVIPLDAPFDWVAGPSLSELVDWLNEPLRAFTASTWAAHVKKQCEESTECTSAIAFSAVNQGDRSWFGQLFSGGPTDADDYVRNDNVAMDVEDSVAFSI